ncbi:MAG: succinate dehydrogenase, cytochrome b556 subunit [Pseudomonadota bacterium]
MANTTPANRPLSPHLQVWRFTPTMAASITHRIFGVGLYTGTVALAAWTGAIALGAEAFAPVGAFFASPFGNFVIFGYIWSLCFHLLAGIRYLYFDSGRGLGPKTATQTSIAIFAGSIVLAILIGLAALAARGAS